MAKHPKKDLVEVFGYAPDDLSDEARSLWKLSACPFTKQVCSKTNHDQTIIYGTCSVTSPYGDCIICPNRLYENNYKSLKSVASDAFGDDLDFLTFSDYLERRSDSNEVVVALGHNSGKEVSVRNLSMDWVLARIKQNRLIEYVGVEVQSIDITGNYRDAWYGYKNLEWDVGLDSIPSSAHGMNWANVHKRLIPQLIRKGLIYSRSELVKSGIYFILPDIVYQKFEEVIGADIPVVHGRAKNYVSVQTYRLSQRIQHGKRREIEMVRSLKFELEEFSQRFIEGATLPTGRDLDNAVRRKLGLE